jgi:hypothetical protein
VNFRRISTWIPLLTLAGVLVGFVVDRTLLEPPKGIEIRSAPKEKLVPLELPARPQTLAGHVVDPSGAPLADALVWLRAHDAPHFAYTDATGAFRMEAIEEPPWRATVLAQGFAPLVRDLEKAEDATFRMDGPLGAPPALPKISRMLLAGEVKGAAPGAAAGDEVVLIPTAAPETLSAPLPRRTKVGADGRFAFDDLIVGEYAVEVRPEWARGGSWPDLLRGIDEPRTRTIDLAKSADASKPEPLALELAVGDLEGKLAGLEGEAIEGGLVLASAASDPSRVFPPETSRADGTFSMRGLPTGRYLLAVRAGSASAQKDVVVSAGRATTVDLPPLDVRRTR